MTPAQFETIAKLIRSREPVMSGARLVLIDEVSGVDAAAATGVSSQSISNTVARFRAADAEIRQAYKIKRIN